MIPVKEKAYTFGAYTIEVYTPDKEEIQKRYAQQQEETAEAAFPYWSQVWPAALGLCDFLLQHTALIQDKQVAELAAGLGLPSLFAARYATVVNSSDHIQEAVDCMQLSMQRNQLLNMQCSLLNWNELPASFAPEVLLVSDINYNEADFNRLYQLVIKLLNNGTTIVLSTPQRLMARPFIDRLLPFGIQQEEIEVAHDNRSVSITVMVLQLVNSSG